MSKDVTILYYTSNREDEVFEKKIRENILKNSSGLPIVSVSQKPIDFGHNICVGKHQNCYYNEFKQIQIGIKNIKTTWVLVTEADVLYPPDYFNFIPSDDFIAYRYTPVWVNFMGKKPSTFYFKGFSDGAQMMHRKQWLERIEKHIGKDIQWDFQGKFATKLVVPQTNRKKVWKGSPAITFKTRKGVGHGTGYEQIKERTLPYWGNIINIKEKYL